MVAAGGIEKVWEVLCLVFSQVVHIGRIDKHFGIGALFEKGGSDRLKLWLHIEVDKAPTLKKGMDAHNRTCITR